MASRAPRQFHSRCTSRWTSSKSSDQPQSAPSAQRGFISFQVVEANPPGEGAGLAQVRQLDAAAADDAADLGETELFGEGGQLPAGDGEQQGVVLATAEREIHAAGEGAGGLAEGKRAALDHRTDAALLAEMPEVLEEAVAHVDGGGRLRCCDLSFAYQGCGPALRASGNWRRVQPEAGGGVAQSTDDHQGVPGTRPRAGERTAGFAQGRDRH